MIVVEMHLVPHELVTATQGQGKHTYLLMLSRRTQSLYDVTGQV
jgi:hypothetical protein